MSGHEYGNMILTVLIGLFTWLEARKAKTAAKQSVVQSEMNGATAVRIESKTDLAAEKATTAVAKTEELVQKADENTQITLATHSLVNGNYLALFRENVALLEEISEADPGDKLKSSRLYVAKKKLAEYIALDATTRPTKL